MSDLEGIGYDFVDGDPDYPKSYNPEFENELGDMLRRFAQNYNLMIENRNEPNNGPYYQKLAERDEATIVSILQTAKLKTIVALFNEIYACSPTKKFENWKPHDALMFYERLKELEDHYTK